MNNTAILVEQIKWDFEGMTLEECKLPDHVLFINLPEMLPEEDEIEEFLSETLSDRFGFNHAGFDWKLVALTTERGFSKPNMSVTMYSYADYARKN